MLGRVLGVTALAALSFTACVKKKTTDAQSKWHLGGSDQSGKWMNPENSNVGIYHTKPQKCMTVQKYENAAEIKAEYHIKSQGSHAFINELWAFICLEANLERAALYDVEGIALAFMKVADSSQQPRVRRYEGPAGEYYQIVDGINSIIGGARTPDIALIRPYTPKSFFEKTIDWASGSHYHVQVYNHYQSETRYPQGGYKFSHWRSNLPLTDFWSLDKISSRGDMDAPPDDVGLSSGQQPGEFDVNPNNPSEASANRGVGKRVLNVWNGPALYGWELKDFSLKNDVHIGRKILLLLPMLPEFHKFRRQAAKASGMSNNRPSNDNPTGNFQREEFDN